MKIHRWTGAVILTITATSRLMGSHARSAGGPGGEPLGVQVPGTPASTSAPSTVSAITATLEQVRNQSQPRRSTQLRLSVENRGATPMTLLRLRTGWLEYSGPDAWHIQIEGPAGSYQFPIFDGAVALPTTKDLINLRPGESFGTVVNVGDTFPSGNPNAPHLFATPGTYRATLSFDTPIDNGFLKFLKNEGAFLQPIRSNTLQFTVGPG